MSMELVVIAEHSSLTEPARRTADSLSVPFRAVESVSDLSEVKAALILGIQGWSMQQLGKGSPGAVRVDFVSGAADHRRKYGGGKSQAVVKALGLKGAYRPSVLDATAGLGRDAFVLATQGCEVQLLERSPVIHCLLHDGLLRAENDPEVAVIVSRMSDYCISAHEHLMAMQETGERVDIVYLDPMFPHRTKSALVKKEMRIFRELIGNDNDADELLPLARQVARYRVIVKRPRNAPWLADRKPQYSLEGKSGRFDLYVKEALPSSVNA